MHTQIATEEPALALSPFDCLAYTDCHGAARTRGSEATGRIIDSMDMIMKGGGTNREGPIPWDNTLGSSARFATALGSRIKLGLSIGAHAPTPFTPLYCKSTCVFSTLIATKTRGPKKVQRRSGTTKYSWHDPNEPTELWELSELSRWR